MFSLHSFCSLNILNFTQRINIKYLQPTPKNRPYDLSSVHPTCHPVTAGIVSSHLATLKDPQVSISASHCCDLILIHTHRPPTPTVSPLSDREALQDRHPPPQPVRSVIHSYDFTHCTPTYLKTHSLRKKLLYQLLLDINCASVVIYKRKKSVYKFTVKPNTVLT